MKFHKQNTLAIKTPQSDRFCSFQPVLETPSSIIPVTKKILEPTGFSFQKKKHLQTADNISISDKRKDLDDSERKARDLVDKTRFV